MARFSRLGKVKESTAEGKAEAKKKKQEELDFREGAKLPWPGVLMVVAGVIFTMVSVFFLLYQIDQPALGLWQMAAGILSGLGALTLIFFPFIKWAHL